MLEQTSECAEPAVGTDEWVRRLAEKAAVYDPKSAIEEAFKAGAALAPGRWELWAREVLGPEEYDAACGGFETNALRHQMLRNRLGRKMATEQAIKDLSLWERWARGLCARRMENARVAESSDLRRRIEELLVALEETGSRLERQLSRVRRAACRGPLAYVVPASSDLEGAAIDELGTIQKERNAHCR